MADEFLATLAFIAVFVVTLSAVGMGLKWFSDSAKKYLDRYHKRLHYSSQDESVHYGGTVSGQVSHPSASPQQHPSIAHHQERARQAIRSREQIQRPGR